MCYDLVVDSSFEEEKINSNLKKGFFNLMKPYNLVGFIKCVLMEWNAIKEAKP